MNATGNFHTRLFNLIRKTEDYLQTGYRIHKPVEEVVLATEPMVDGKPSGNENKNDAGLDSLKKEIAVCSLCRLAGSRKKAVPGSGSVSAKVFIVYDLPGSTDDVQGVALSGKTGEYFDKWISAIGLDRRKDCFITPLVKCRPPSGRTPAGDEYKVCIEYLEKQIALVKPAVVLTLGRTATAVLCGSDDSFSALRQRRLRYKNHELIATFHPEEVLADERLKRAVWEDLKLVKTVLDEIH